MYETLAMLTMLADHIGKIFFPSVPAFHIIGRLALPFYTYGIIQGLRYTHNFRVYLLRLLMLAVISQFFYFPLFGNRLNIIFTLIVALVLLKLFARYTVHTFVAYILIILVGFLLDVFYFEAGLYTLVLAAVYFYKKYIIFGHVILTMFFVLLMRNSAAWIQLVSLAATVMIAYLRNIRLQGHMRGIYRIFYPLHLGVLLLFKSILT